MKKWIYTKRLSLCEFTLAEGAAHTNISGITNDVMASDQTLLRHPDENQDLSISIDNRSGVMRNNKQKDICKKITDLQSLKIDSGSEAGMTSCRRYAAFTLAEGAAHANMSTNFRQYAFTLAEVLIALGIIGIVAAMTIPTIIHNYQAKLSLAALKKNYSLMVQALDMYYAQTGTKVTVETTGHRELKSILMEQLRTVKDCSYGYGSDVDKACIKNYNDTSLNATTYTTYNGNTIYLQPFDDGQFVLNDGSLVLLENNTTAALYISIDINGYNKQPNRLGQDLFMFQIDERGVLLPMGAEGTTYSSSTYCSSTSTSNMNGAGCTYKALTDKDFFKNLP